MKLCGPAMVYFAFACLSILFGLMGNISGMSLVAKGIWAILWTYILNFVCEKGYETISWFLVLLPFVLMFGIVSLVLDQGRQNQTQPTQSNQSYQPPVNQPYQPPVYHHR